MRPSPTLLVAAVGLVVGAATVAFLPGSLLFVPAPPPATADDMASGNVRYACPMMDFIGTRPGPCPSCGMDMNPVTAGELQLEQVRRLGLRTTIVTEGPAVVTARASGIADYDHRFTRLVVPRVSGRIIARHEATFGCCEDVFEGDPIVDLYSPEVIEAQGDLAAARRLGDETLVRNLRERFVRWNLVEIADAVLRGEPARDVVTIRAPFAGQTLLEDEEMVNQDLAVGREIEADMPLLRLVNPDRLVLVVQVPEHRAHGLLVGQPVEIATDAAGVLRDLEAEVGRVANEISPTLRSREVRIHLEKARGKLLPGTLVEARIRTALGPNLEPADPQRENTWGRFAMVPKSAILSTGVRHVAWKLVERRRDGRLRFEPVAVALGPRIESPDGSDVFVVRSGLVAGDEVATQGAFLIDSQAQLAGTPSLLFPTGATGAAADPHAGHDHGSEP